MAKESNQALKARTGKIVAALKKTYPDAYCELDYRNPLELLIAIYGLASRNIPRDRFFTTWPE